MRDAKLLKFACCSEAVSACGGDVLKFAGDALICMFGSNTDVEPIFMTTLRAVQVSKQTRGWKISCLELELRS